jgi:hypothetical protein
MTGTWSLLRLISDWPLVPFDTVRSDEAAADEVWIKTLAVPKTPSRSAWRSPFASIR